MTLQDIFDPWARRYSWFSLRPDDLCAYEEMIAKLIMLERTPTQHELEAAIYNRVHSHPLVQGGPRYVRPAVTEMATRILARLA